MWLLNKANHKLSSRKQIKIKGVKDGILILPDNKYRAVLTTSSINFELKSEVEQDVIIDNFENFLNSLTCPIQILVRVREIDVDQYIEQILIQRNNEHEKVYKQQIKNYAEFIKTLVADNKILSRQFYIIIPHIPKEKNEEFSLIKGQLKLNAEVVIRGLEKLGMKVRMLNSIEVLELFYTFYNGSYSKIQPLNTELSEGEVANV